MKLKLKDKFIALITRYKADLAAYNQRREKINAEMEIVRKAATSMTQNDYLNGQIPDHSTAYYYGELTKLDQNMGDTDAKYNAEIRSLLQNAVDQLKGLTATTDNHQLRVQNALSYIGLIGDKLIDEQAWNLISPLFGDYVTMEQLYWVLEGRGGLPTTIKALSGYLDVATRLKSRTEESEFLFSHRSFSSNPLGMELKFGILSDSLETADEDTAFTDGLIKMTFFEAERTVGQKMFDWATYKATHMA